MRRLRAVTIGVVLAFVAMIQVLPAEASGGPQVIGFGKNLIVNGGGESNVGGMGAGSGPAPRFWKRTGTLEVIKYGAYGGFPSATTPGPKIRGRSFFSGGYNTTVQTRIEQTLDLTWAAATVDAGKAKYVLSGWLGGYGSDDNNARLVVIFRNAAGRILGSKAIGPVMAAQRAGQTSFLLRQATAAVPKKTRRATVQLKITKVGSATYVSGYADNLSLVLTKTP